MEVRLWTDDDLLNAGCVKWTIYLVLQQGGMEAWQFYCDHSAQKGLLPDSDRHEDVPIYSGALESVAAFSYLSRA
jgi:hypothetical protein